MARVNIEDELFLDPRFYDLVSKSHNQMEAIGRWVFAVKLAQKFYRDGGLIPRKEWESRKMGNQLIESGLAEVRDEHIYLKGSEAHLSWLNQCSKGGSSKSQIKLNALEKLREKKKEKNDQKRLEASLKPSEADLKGLELPPLTLTKKKEENIHTGPQVAPNGVQAGMPPKLSEAELLEGIDRAWKTWVKTLHFFGMQDQPNISPIEQTSIYRGIMNLGVETVCLALEGQRYEPKHDGYNPADHLSIDRILHRGPNGKPSKWQECRNRALQNRSAKINLRSARVDLT